MKNIISNLGIFLVIFGFVFLPSVAYAAEEDSGTETGPQWEYVNLSTEDKIFKFHDAVTIDGLIYIVGGYYQGNATDKAFVYNPQKNEIYPTSQMARPRSLSGNVVYDGKIYCFGGNVLKGANNPTDTIEIYDPKIDTWSISESIMPTARRDFKAVVVGDDVYLLGGYVRGSSYVNTMDIYHTKTGTWSSGASMPRENITEFGCIVLQNKIYIFGGVDQVGANHDINNQILCYDPLADSWSEAGTMPQTLNSMSVTSYNNKAIITGGIINNRVSPLYLSKFTYIYDPVSQTCVEGPKLNTVRYDHASAVVGGVAYALYGVDDSVHLTTIEKLDLSKLIPSPPVSQNLTVLLNTDETIQLSVSNNLADNAELTWTSSDSSVAQVDEDGKVTAIASGECSIAVEGSGEAYQEFIPVKVFDGNADQYRLAVNLKPEQTAKLHLTQDPTRTTWTSHDTAVATMNTTGKVTAVSDGLVIIEGKADSQSHHIYVRVKI